MKCRLVFISLMATFLLLPTMTRLHAKNLGVLSQQARKQNLLEYVNNRTDLTTIEKQQWDKAIRLTFGGKALKDGQDEGVTVAKSVISAAIFFQITPKKGSKAAYAAYHDTYRWIPPPIAIEYQILDFLGKKPKVRSWDLAYDFPSHFNEEIAPDLVSWWEEMLAANKIPDYEVEKVKTTLKKTKALMKPLLLERLEMGARLEYQLQTPSLAPDQKRDIQELLADIQQEITHSFKNVSHTPLVDNTQNSWLKRYQSFSKEINKKPAFQPKPPVHQQQKQKQKPKQVPQKTQPPKQTKTKPSSSQIPSGNKPRSPIEAPYPGQPLIVGWSQWQQELTKNVKKWLGVPYKFGGMSKRGIDCSAFTMKAISSLNIKLPRNSQMQARRGLKIAKKDLKAGDLVFFDTLDRGRITHVGLYMGAGKITHASSSRGVTYDRLASRYFSKAYRLARRIIN